MIIAPFPFGQIFDLQIKLRGPSHKGRGRKVLGNYALIIDQIFFIYKKIYMKHLILSGLFFTLTNLVFSETLTMIYEDYGHPRDPLRSFASIKLFSDDPLKKKYNSSKGFFGDIDNRLKPNVNAKEVEEIKLAEKCWGEFLGTHYSLESVLEKLIELGYKPRSAYVYDQSHSLYILKIHTFIFEKN